MCDTTSAPVKKRIQRCGICQCPGHRRTNCHVFLFNFDATPGQNVEQVRKIKSRTTKPKIETVHEYMKSWRAKNDTSLLTESDYKRLWVSESNKSFERYTLDTALKSQHLYYGY